MIKIRDLSISFAGHLVFEDVNITINRGEKVGFIGRNGSGKSTFLKLVLSKLEPDSGEIEIPKGYKIGHLEQHIKFSHSTAIAEVCSVLPEEREYEGWKGEEILTGLGFSPEEMQKDPSEFSGGYQVKLNLAKLLLDEPNMLLLDEPTNYLDIHSVRWLKRFLQEWDGELILITHDRDFMDSVISHTLNIHRGNFKKTSGNTQNVREKIALEEEMYEKTRINEEKQREKTEEWINRFKAKASMASRAQSKMKMLEKQDKKEKLEHIATLDFEFNCLPYISKDNLLEVNNITFGYNGHEPLIKKLSFRIGLEDKICVIGKNGKGKSTLLKLITGDLSPLEGGVRINNKTEIGYFGQMNIDRLNPELSIYEEMQNYAPTVPQTNVRRVCGNMMFSGTLSNKKIGVLSGGEKSRVMLGKILLKPSNLLLLDEPTNHLDMESCDSLKEAIKSFEGAVLMVTHSEYFLKEIANKLIVFDNDKISVFEGGYEDFLRKVGWSDE
ncbi:MAG: ATP-binding protein of an transporter complex [Rickettsiaceae bacterium]|jgi:ATP-binding cassette subfamily F protein 3|nr:ATP-binding protein of an transporter complex [Rickettsiaceae bacterium]